MKVGEIAARTGLTVRTLHHYHEIGLLVPGDHSPGEVRRYSAADLARLLQIQSLRGLGFSLEEVGRCLESAEPSALRTVELRLERLTVQIESARRLRGRLERIAGQLRATGRASADDLLETIEESVMFEKYYTPEQLQQLQERAKVVGQDRMQAVQAEWSELFRQFREAQDRGLDPACEEVQALSRKATALIEEFTGGDEGILRSLTRMHREEGAENVLGRHGQDVPPGVMEYMARARGAASDGPAAG